MQGGKGCGVRAYVGGVGVYWVKIVATCPAVTPCSSMVSAGVLPSSSILPVMELTKSDMAFYALARGAGRPLKLSRARSPERVEMPLRGMPGTRCTG